MLVDIIVTRTGAAIARFHFALSAGVAHRRVKISLANRGLVQQRNGRDERVA